MLSHAELSSGRGSRRGAGWSPLADLIYFGWTAVCLGPGEVGLAGPEVWPPPPRCHLECFVKALSF